MEDANTMSNSNRLHEHICEKTGARYVSTTDASGKHTLTVDEENAYLLRDVSWTVAPVRCGSDKLQARASTSAPRVNKGQLLHRRVFKSLRRDRRVRAIDGNLLHATKTNLQVVSLSDLAILNRACPADKVVGVQHAIPPRWLKTPCHYHARIRFRGRYVHLGSFRTLEEAACCFDGAARRLYGPDAISNRSLGLVAEKTFWTKVCRRAYRVGKHKIAKLLERGMLEKARAFQAEPTMANFIAMGLGYRRDAQPRVRVRNFADAGV
jgi:hypothetical protein